MSSRADRNRAHERVPEYIVLWQEHGGQRVGEESDDIHPSPQNRQPYCFV